MSGRELDRLWAGWRLPYVADSAKEPAPGDPAGGRGSGSVFTGILEATAAGTLTDEEARIVHRGAHAFAILNAFPYSSGHLLVLPYREVAELSALRTEEADDVWRIVRDGVAAVEAAYQPDGVNVGFNLGRAAGAGVPTHLHGHVVPRWSADTNFMTSIAEARVLPESLGDSWTRLVAAWPT